MRSALLIVHILSAVLLIGPVTFAASAFPRQVATAAEGDIGALGAARVLHRVSRSYGRATAVVGVAGAGLGLQSALWSEAWVWISLVVFSAALVLLILVIIPTQGLLLRSAEAGEPVAPAVKGRLHSTTGLYSIAWVVVLILMVVKPG